jgi:putative transposase
MRKSKFSEEQIIGVLKEHQAGLPVAEICRRPGSATRRSTRGAQNTAGSRCRKRSA